MQSTRARRLAGGLTGLVILAAIAVASILTITPPAPQSGPTGTSDFVAARAFEDVQTIGAKVHVAGSDAAREVRDHIVDTLTGLGLSPQVREGIGQTAALGGPAMAYVRNVVAEIPGSDSTGRLFLVAHYDSVQVSYGANDDGSGVATLLEVARNLAAGPQLRNDVVLLFTDAEEACLCGAESFVHSDPLATGGGVVLNFEARGANGPSVMFETAAGNAGLVAAYADAVPYPVATSMAVEVYRILPNDTDFTPFRESGRFTGLNSAYIDGVPVYHSPQDRPENLDRGTLQQHGANALALARSLGGADLGPLAVPGSQDATYFPVLGHLVQYPGALVWVIAILALLAVLALAYMVRRRLPVGWGRLAAGFGLMVVPLAGAAVVAQLLWMLLVALRPAYGSMTDPWQPSYFRLAVCALVVVVVVGWYALWRRRITPWALTTGALAWLALLGIVMAAAVPGGSYLAALPALVGALLGLAALVLRNWWLRLGLVTVAGAVAVVILAPTAVLFFPALGLATGAAGALMVAMLLLALLPGLEYLHPALDEAASSAPRDHRRLTAALPTLVATVLAVALTVTGLVADRFDAKHPEQTQLMYALDADTGHAYWVSEQDDADGWLAQYVTGKRDLSGTFPLLHGSLLAGPAQATDLPASTLSINEVSFDPDGPSVIDVTVQPQRPVRLLDLSSPDVKVLAATVTAAGVSRDVDLSEAGDDEPFELLFHAPPAGGITVRLTVADTSDMTFRVLDGSDGLDELPGFVPRPEGVGVKGSHTSELVLVAVERSVSVQE